MQPLKHHTRKVRLLAELALVLMCALFPSSGNAGNDSPTYTIAVLPQRPPVVMYARWRPLLDRLEKEAGITLKLKLYESTADFQADIAKGTPDFMYSTPPQLVVVRGMQGYIPLVRGSRKLSGVLFVRNDSPIRTVDDLESGEIAFSGSWNICSVLVQNVLHKDHPDLKFKQLYAGSMNNVVNHVLLGKAAAGSVIDVEFENIAPETRTHLRPLLETQKIFPHPLSAHPRVPKSVRDKLASAILALWEDEAGNALLVATRITNPVRADYQRDYRHLENIDLMYPGN